MPKYSVTHCNYLVAELLTQPLSIGPMIRRPELCVARIWCLVRGKHCLSIAISETFDFICFRLSSYAVAMLSQSCVWGCWKRSKVCYQGNDLPVPWGSRCVWGRADWTFVSLVHRNTNLGPKVQTSLSAWSSTTALASISSWSLTDWFARPESSICSARPFYQKQKDRRIRRRKKIAFPPVSDWSFHWSCLASEEALCCLKARAWPSQSLKIITTQERHFCLIPSYHAFSIDTFKHSYLLVSRILCAPEDAFFVPITIVWLWDRHCGL